MFNGTIPLIAIQMSALEVGGQITLVFTTVLDQVEFGLVEDDEATDAVADRAYWEARGTKETLAMVDKALEMIHAFDPDVELKYNKFYIGLAKRGRPCNYVLFRAKKTTLGAEVKLPRSDEESQRLEEAGLDLMDYDKRFGRYRIRLAPPDLKKHADLLTDLLRRAREDSRP